METGKQEVLCKRLSIAESFATGARLVLGQEACAEKSNELTAIPVLLEALMLKGVIEAERTINGKTSCERRLYIGSIAPDAAVLTNAVRAHWGIENSIHLTFGSLLSKYQPHVFAAVQSPFTAKRERNNQLFAGIAATRGKAETGKWPGSLSFFHRLTGTP